MPVGALTWIRIVVIGLCSPQGDNMIENSQRIQSCLKRTAKEAKTQVYLDSAVIWAKPKRFGS